MPVFLLNEELYFPDPNEAVGDGLLAVGGDLSPDRLLLAYEKGIFPWYNPRDPILWWSPDPRCVLFPEKLHISKSMRNILNRDMFQVKADTAFEQVLRKCKNAPRDQEGTWISEDIVQAYCKLHELGMAHSVETWKDGKLVGGLYGVSIGRMFFGESMFTEANNASKVAFIRLVRTLQRLDFEVIDCQIYNEHLGSLGAENISRKEFLKLSNEQLRYQTRKGNWTKLFAGHE